MPVNANDRHLCAMLVSLGLALVLLLNPSAARGQNKKHICDHPPKMLSQPSFSDEDRAKWKGNAVCGKVALVISENGDLADAKILTASPREVTETLLSAVKR